MGFMRDSTVNCLVLGEINYLCKNNQLFCSCIINVCLQMRYSLYCQNDILVFKNNSYILVYPKNIFTCNSFCAACMHILSSLHMYSLSIHVHEHSHLLQTDTGKLSKDIVISCHFFPIITDSFPVSHHCVFTELSGPSDIRFFDIQYLRQNNAIDIQNVTVCDLTVETFPLDNVHNDIPREH